MDIDLGEITTAALTRELKSREEAVTYDVDNIIDFLEQNDCPKELTEALRTWNYLRPLDARRLAEWKRWCAQ